MIEVVTHPPCLLSYSTDAHHICYTLMVVWLIFSSVRLYRSQSTDATSAYLIKLSVGTYVTGVPLWLLDYYACSTFQVSVLRMKAFCSYMYRPYSSFIAFPTYFAGLVPPCLVARLCRFWHIFLGHVYRLLPLPCSRRQAQTAGRRELCSTVLCSARWWQERRVNYSKSWCCRNKSPPCRAKQLRMMHSEAIMYHPCDSIMPWCAACFLRSYCNRLRIGWSGLNSTVEEQRLTPGTATFQPLFARR
jgi:hypothetical protein